VVSFWRDRTGSVLVEYSVVFPLFILVILGAVDSAYMLLDWGLANKAAYMGARTAVISNPVAQNITNLTYTATQSQHGGELCFNATTGAANTDSNGNNYCPTVSSVCTGASGGNGSCTNGYTFDPTAFASILGKMQTVFPRVQAQNVQISYSTNGLGFVLQPGGLPMNVTVSIIGMTHEFFFLPPILSSFGGFMPVTPNIPTFATTMQSEDMFTN